MSLFKRNKKTRLKRTMFDKSHERKLSLKMGNLYPCFLDEVVPGDTINLSTEALVRMAPLVAPVMHRVDTYIHYFFVPNRIIWDSWEDFITGNEELTVPSYTAGSYSTILQKGRLGDYLGLPVATTITGSDIEISKLPFRVYNKVWNEFYRDQDLQNEVGEDQVLILKRAWEKDYFTSARPWAQKGDAPQLPIISSVEYMDQAQAFNDTTTIATGAVTMSGPELDEKDLKDKDGIQIGIRNISEVESGLSINDIRTTAAIQQFLEKKARGGSRYAEYLLSIFGVRSSDARLQRPEYLGGGKQPVTISEVLNTSDTTEAPQGNMSGHGISVGQTNNVNKFFNEHGYVIGLISVVPKPTYNTQGIHKLFSRTDQYDFFIPQFANLGEQEVLNKELYFDPTDDEGNAETFGYQSRYAEMKYMADSNHGDFRDTLRQWTFARNFGDVTRPVLNDEFIECEVDAQNQFAGGDEDDYLWVQLYHRYKAIRPMPYFGTPGLTKI